MVAARKSAPGKKKFGLTGKSLTYAIGVHVIIGVLLFVSFNFTSDNVQKPAAKPQVQPIQASVLTEAEVRKQLDVFEERENKKKLEQEQAEKKVQDLLKKQKLEEEKLVRIKKEQELQKLKVAEEAKKAEALARKQEEEKSKAELARQKQAEEKKKAELARKKKAEEEKRKAELARKKKEDEKKKAELARKKKLEEEQRKKELALKQQMEAERQQRELNSALAQYIPIIKQKVSRNWNKPADLQNGITAKVAVRLTANGEVVSAQLTRSSGNSVFDRSVVNAVYKASPLPIPQERGVNERFRELDLKFNPEDLI